jgi:hypothetical protein
MSETTAILVMMNNYFHDVATALLIASGVAMWVMLSKYDDATAPEAANYIIRIYKSMSRLACAALAWIVIGGIPRTIFYKRFEWVNAAGRGQVTALVAKHVLAFILVGAGAYAWTQLSRKISKLRETAR